MVPAGGIIMDKGYFQIYTGTGKGKTTAALGLTMRAAGAGLSVYIGQFIKSMEYHEIGILRDRFPEVTVELYGIEGCIVNREPDANDKKAAADGLARAAEILMSGSYDIMILDEFFIAMNFGLISEKQAMDLVDSKAEGTELIMTGRYAPEALIDRADLVTDMNEVRHYWTQGVEARDGIER
jgi:cob(I)alamin adenosyltransferase